MEGDMTPLTVDLVHDMPETGPVNMEEANGSLSDQSLNGPQVQGMGELQAILEALLFVSSEPLSVARLVTVMGNVPKSDVEEALRHLGQALDQDGRGVRLAVVAGGYRLVTKLDYAPWIKRLDKAKTSAKLSRSALESLAIIAYKQPLVRSEVEEIRGVETSGVLRTLLERKLVRIVGRKEVPGRPIMYGTTKFFLEHFGLSDLSQLPPLREFKELGEAEQASLPMDGGEVLSEEGSIETIETSVEPSVNGDLQTSTSLDETLDPLPAAQ
ncbi:MAG: SMC-Scp complex subunit ScpB [Nitrospira sp.]|nr:MAG: SMC-Scp complex subunit ScpB [Nitrospira sp.]